MPRQIKKGRAVFNKGGGGVTDTISKRFFHPKAKFSKRTSKVSKPKPKGWKAW
jgi:hypothetical protein